MLAMFLSQLLFPSGHQSRDDLTCPWSECSSWVLSPSNDNCLETLGLTWSGCFSSLCFSFGQSVLPLLKMFLASHSVLVSRSVPGQPSLLASCDYPAGHSAGSFPVISTPTTKGRGSLSRRNGNKNKNRCVAMVDVDRKLGCMCVCVCGGGGGW